MVSGTISLPCLGFFSPFPHGTSSLSVSQEYLALRDGPRRFRQDFTCPALLRILLGKWFFTCTGLSPTMVKLSRKVPLKITFHVTVLQPSYCRNNMSLGCSPFARHYWGNHSCFLVHRVLRCFSSPGLLPDYSGFHVFNMKGCPIRKSTDQKDICSSPWLIAAYHVLLRLWEPRHPPYALNYFLCCLTT
jgi:hypothetical protein